MGSILVVDDERSMREFLAICLRRGGHQVAVADSGEKALEALAQPTAAFDLVITDLRMTGQIDGLGVLAEVKARTPRTQVILVTAYATAETALAAMKQGAYDYLTKPFKLDEIQVVVDRALERQALAVANAELRELVAGRYRLGSILGKSPAMARVFDMLRKVAATRTSVLLTGESGTGKELAARALHAESPRKEAAFVAVNCGAIPETLIESELFGHVKGAFTGASSAKEGLFVAADGGTLFLDEIGELPTAMQVKLLRVLQERKVKQVGAVEEKSVDVRLVAATNRDLEAEVARGAFRQDLFYRLNVIQVHLPPLRQRREDLPLLIEHFIKRYAGELDKRVVGIAPDALAALMAYDFPGNVRELENLIERAVTLETANIIDRDSLPELTPTRKAAPSGQVMLGEGFDLDRMLADTERVVVEQALAQANGVRKEAARLLGVTFRSLRYRLAKLGIDSSAIDSEREASDPDA